MQKKLTITIDQEVYEGLYRKVGSRRISKFIEETIRPIVMETDLEAGYAAKAADEEAEREAAEWVEGTYRDIAP